VRVTIPHLIVPAGILVTFPQKIAALLARALPRFVDRHNHRSQERRLGAREEICAIRIQHRPIVFDLIEEVLYHAPRQRNSLVFDQATYDEVAIPAIHFIEPATWDNVAVLEIEQTGRGDVGGDLARAGDRNRQLANLYLAVLLQLSQNIGHRRVRGDIKDGRLRQLGVDDAFAIAHRAGKSVPSSGNVMEDGIESVASIGWRWLKGKGSG